MKNKLPDRVRFIYLLEEDENLVNQTERFGHSEDFMFELCKYYLWEAKDHLKLNEKEI